jgi:hypothetical protein
MAVALKLTYLQSNDAKTIVLTDDTGGYDVSTNNGGWGTPNELTSDVVSVTTTTLNKYHVTLDITYTSAANVVTVYDTIDLYDNFTSEFGKSYGMIYTLDMSYLEVSGVVAGTDDDVFPDGIYDITYSITNANTDAIIYEIDYPFLVDGVIRKKVYDNLNDNFSTIYKQKQFNADERDWQELLEAEFLGCCLHNFEIPNDDSNRSKKLEVLYYLEQKLN